MIEKQLLAWKAAEQAAQNAEAAIDRIGQGAADPRVAVMLAEAKALRTRADALFQDVLAALPADRP